MNPKSTIRLALATATLFCLGACESLKGESLDATLKSIGSFAGEVSTWSSKLSESGITETNLTELGDFASKAGNLGDTLKAALGSADEDAKTKTSDVQDNLKKLADFDTEKLKGLEQEQQKSEVSNFSSIASELKTLVEGLLAK